MVGSRVIVLVNVVVATTSTETVSVSAVEVKSSIKGAKVCVSVSAWSVMVVVPMYPAQTDCRLSELIEEET